MMYECMHDVRMCAHARASSQLLLSSTSQIRPDDPFGQVMMSNLASRGCPLRGLPACPSLDAHMKRLREAGFVHTDARDMDVLYSRMLPREDVRRIERLEMFDEFEEWHLIQQVEFPSVALVCIPCVHLID